MKKIAIFASGTGTNAQRIIEYFKEHPTIQVACVLSNKSDAPVLEKAQKLGVSTRVFDRNSFYQTDEVVKFLQENQIEWIVLAGFLWLVPQNLIEAFPEHIINIHPALLPQYGGKGMYGMKVHEAVWQARETQTGITIHYVNEKFDEGKIIFQASCSIAQEDTPESIAQKVHQLEYVHFAQVIEQLLLG